MAGKFIPGIRTTLAFVLTVSALLFAADMPSRLGVSIYTEQFLALVLGISLAIVFLAERPSPGSTLEALQPSPLSCILAATGLAIGVFIAIDYPQMISRSYSLTWDVIALGTALFFLVLEGLRRAVGWTLVIVVLAICGYGLIGHLVEGPLQTREVAPQRLVSYLAVDANGVFGLTLNVAATVVIAFVFFGQLLLKSGGADFFNDIALATMGRRRGGAAKISILASGLFGSISGVVVSNIVATGVVTIRLMVDAGLRRHQAAAVEAVASTGGQIVPPVMGAVAFLMADVLQRPYSEIVVAAIVPALLYYIALFVQVDLGAARDKIAPVDESLIPEPASVMRSGWVFLLPFAIIVWAIFFALQRPETAAIWGAGAALFIGMVIGYRGKRMSIRDFTRAFVESGSAIVDIVLIAAAAGLIIGTLNVTGLGFGLTFSLVALGDGSLFLLLLISAVVCIVLGMGMPTVGVYLLLAVLVAPSLVESGVDPIAAHLFIFYLGMMSMVTPPVAIGAFFAASIAKAGPIRTAVEAMRLGWTAYLIPFLFVASPSLLLKGNWTEITISVGSAILGVWAGSAMLVGYLAGKLSPLSRIAMGLAAILMLLPGPLIPFHALWFDLVGAAIFFTTALANTRTPPERHLQHSQTRTKEVRSDAA
jgi:TRAP transporter 4TM/12TM fusion protein